MDTINLDFILILLLVAFILGLVAGVSLTDRTTTADVKVPEGGRH